MRAPMFRVGVCCGLCIVLAVQWMMLFPGRVATPSLPASRPVSTASLRTSSEVTLPPSPFLSVKIREVEVAARFAVFGGAACLQWTRRPPSIVPHRWKYVEEVLAAVSAGRSVHAEGEVTENSVAVSEEDLRRARNNVIVPLPRRLPIRQHFFDVLSTEIFNAMRDFVQGSMTDNSPIFVDFGCYVGHEFASANPNATIICLSPGETHARVPNILHIPSQHGWDDGHLLPLYTTCNSFSGAFVFDLLFARDSEDAFASQRRGARLSLLMRALPIARVLFVAMEPSELQDLVAQVSFDTGSVTAKEWQGVVERMIVKIAVIAVVTTSRETVECVSAADMQSGIDGTGLLDAVGRRVIVRISVVESLRSCSKTWNAPLVQWDRRVLATTFHGRVGFKAVSVKKKNSGLGRTIHPLQYIPSVNLDTLLGAGLSENGRVRLLGQMIATPRYSDPLPHNWIVGPGAQALRIDKIDKRYDKDVDESKGYWGRSTRGYLHLLAHHLCLPVGQDGLPLAFTDAKWGFNGTCETACRQCVWCSYLPKGSPPCSPCATCGQCLSFAAERFSSDTPPESRDASDPAPRCQVTYASMHQARAVWAKWEKQDNKFLKTHAA